MSWLYSLVPAAGAIVGWELGKATIRAVRNWYLRRQQRHQLWAYQYIIEKYGSPEHAWNREPK